MADTASTPPERIQSERLVAAPPSAIFAVLRDPQGHVAIDASGMLQSAAGEPAGAVDDTFVVHMDRESLGDYPQLGKYDVTVHITAYEPDRAIEWTIQGTIKPPIGHVYGYVLEPAEAGTTVTAYCDWSNAHEKWKPIFPVISETNLRATLGILERTVRRGYPRGE